MGRTLARSLVRQALSLAVVAVFSHTLAAQSWTQLSPSGTLPAGRGLNGTTGVYDPGSNEMIVFGGRDSGGNNLNDVWVLTNANGQGSSQWINLIANGASGSPPARSGHSAVYDTSSNTMIIFGGCSGYCAPVLNDVWVLSNANGQGGTPAWTKLEIGGAAPAARTNSAVIYDQASNRMVVFGGQDGSADACSSFSDLWVLRNANGRGGSPGWTSLATLNNSGATPPAGRYAAAAAYDPVTQVMTVFGGTGMVHGSCQASNAVWELALNNAVPAWTNVVAEGATGSPAARSFHSAVYDATGGRMLIFGGNDGRGTVLGDVWSLANATGLGTPAWTKLSPSGGPPAARNGHAAVFDSTNQLMTIFGGNGPGGWLNDTWVLSAPGVSGLSCAAVSTPNIVRAEGLAELVGDDVLMCTGGAPTLEGQPIPEYTVTVTLSTTATSRPVAPGSLSEAILLIDEPFPEAPIPSFLTPNANEPPQHLCKPLGSTCAETGTGGSPSPYQTQPNVFVGTKTGPASFQWKVPIDAPGANLVRTLRLSNLRADAQQVSSGRPQISATVTVSGGQPVPVNAPVILASVQPGVTESTNGSTGLLECHPHNAKLIGGAGSAAFDFNVQVGETFPYSFKVRNYGSTVFGSVYPPETAEQNVPGFVYSTESGFYSPSLFTPSPEIALADSGTRIRVKFSGVSPTIHVFLPVSITTQGDFGGRTPGLLQLVATDAMGNSNPGYVPVKATAMVGATPVAEMAHDVFSVNATYEVIYSDPFVIETASIPVALAFNSFPPGISNVASATVSAALAPVSAVGTAVESAPLPRFDGISAALPGYSIYSCPARPLSGSIENTRTGPQNARVWTIDVTGGANEAFGAEILGITLVQAANPPCSPKVVSPASFPLLLGNIPANATAKAQITLDFTGCSFHGGFYVSIPLSANGGSWTGSIQAFVNLLQTISF